MASVPHLSSPPPSHALSVGSTLGAHVESHDSAFFLRERWTEVWVLVQSWFQRVRGCVADPVNDASWNCVSGDVAQSIVASDRATGLLQGRYFQRTGSSLMIFTPFGAAERQSSVV